MKKKYGGWADYVRINCNSLAQFMKTRERPIHISKPVETIMVPATAVPGSPLVQKTVLGRGVTRVVRKKEGEIRRQYRGRGKSIRRIAIRMRHELTGASDR